MAAARPFWTTGLILPASQPARLRKDPKNAITLADWSAEIATMWRFTRNNGITEGFHTKMEVLQRQAYGFRNFQNYRLRVRVMCC